MEDYGKRKIEVLKNDQDTVVLQEKTVFKLSRNQIQMKLQNIAINKDNLVMQSRDIKARYDEYTDEENKLKEILKSLDGGELETL